MTKEILELAKSISPKTIEACRKREPPTAAQREMLEADDCSFIFEGLSDGIKDRYREISASNDNGKCTTRAGTYFKWKTGCGIKGAR